MLTKDEFEWSQEPKLLSLMNQVKMMIRKKKLKIVIKMIIENRIKEGSAPKRAYGIRNLKFYVFEPDTCGSNCPNCPNYGWGL